ncbi:uracil-5--methyltransferase TRM9 [Verticillium dahliae]|nr:uracil-5--methyltransferase TRM9 [Verticillium dahliae]
MSTDTAAAAVASQAPTAPASEDTAATYESTHVHAYLAVSPHLHLLGSDRSANLVALARDNTGGSGAPPKKAKGDGPPVEVTTTGPSARRNQVIVADSLTLPYRLSSVDFALSIAVLHHLSTPSRRRAAVRAILDTLVPANGKALLFVWALEQRNSRRGWDASAPQDQLALAEEKPDETWHRYYHLYKEGELDADIQAVGGVVLESGYERDNWWAICSRGPEER